MTRFERTRAAMMVVSALALVGLAGCGSQRITFIYPNEKLDLSLVGSRTPRVYIDTVTDMRPPVQRRGEGHFLKITFPKDNAWEAPATTLYAEALAQDLEQTGLVELVPLAAQADYRLSADLLSFTCTLQRSATSYLVTGLIGGAAGAFIGGGGTNSLKTGIAGAVAGMMAIPVPTNNHAEAEVRLTLRDRDGDVVWQKSCFGEINESNHVTPTARPDQEMVSRNLTRAVKRADGCLFGQLRQVLSERAQPAPVAARPDSAAAK